eukprot:1621837-Amphidinium_carterae.1
MTTDLNISGWRAPPHPKRSHFTRPACVATLATGGARTTPVHEDIFSLSITVIRNSLLEVFRLHALPSTHGVDGGVSRLTWHAPLE